MRKVSLCSGVIILVLFLLMHCLLNINEKHLFTYHKVMDEFIEMITEHRNVPPFERIKLHSGGTVLLRQGDTFKVEVSAENEAMIDKVKTKVRRNKLNIQLGGWRALFPANLGELEILVQAPDIKQIDVPGIGKVKSDGVFKVQEIKLGNSGVGGLELELDAEYIKINLSGTGDIILSGFADRMDINMSGIGKVDAGALTAQDVKIKSSGIGGCDVFAEQNLKIRASSIGNIRYKGNAKVDSRFSGLGKVEKL